MIHYARSFLVVIVIICNFVIVHRHGVIKIHSICWYILYFLSHTCILVVKALLRLPFLPPWGTLFQYHTLIPYKLIFSTRSWATWCTLLKKQTCVHRNKLMPNEIKGMDDVVVSLLTPLMTSRDEEPIICDWNPITGTQLSTLSGALIALNDQ